MHKNVAIAFIALALCGCGTLLPELNPPPKGGDSVELTKQQNGRFIAFVGPRLQHTEPFLGVAGTNFFALRSWLDTKTGDVAHQLYVADSYYGGPYRWEGVHDGDNKPLRFIPISRNEITCEAGCAYFDEFAAVLPEDLLRAHKGGLSITFTANKNGKSLAIDVPGRLVAEELAAVDNLRAATPRAEANAAPSAPTPAAAPPPGSGAPAPGTVVPPPK